MTTRRLSITGSVARAYHDLARTAGALRVPLIFAVLIILAVKVAEDLIPMRVWSGPVIGAGLGLVEDAIRNFLLTPILIAIHRFIILDEAAPGYALNPTQPNFMPFFGWLVVLSVLTEVVFSVQELLTALGLPALIALIPTLVVLVAVVAFSLRLTILFPAIAIDARGAGAASALAATRGHVLSILAIFVLALLPWAALAVGITLLLGPGVRNPGTPVAMVSLVVGAVIQTAVTTLCLAIASRLFQALRA